MGSQCKDSKIGVIWSLLLALVWILAAEVDHIVICLVFSVDLFTTASALQQSITASRRKHVSFSATKKENMGQSWLIRWHFHFYILWHLEPVWIVTDGQSGAAVYIMDTQQHEECLLKCI